MRHVVRQSMYIFGAVIATAGAARANLLTAPGFEVADGAPSAAAGDTKTGSGIATANPWAGYGSGGTPNAAYYSAVRAGVTPHGGGQFGFVLGTGGSNAGGIYQNVTGSAVVVGDTYTATAWFYNNAGGDALQQNAALTATATDQLQLKFQNASGGTISTSLSAILDYTTPTGTWIQLTATGVAPAGTTSIQLQGFLNHPSGTHGILIMDDAVLADASVAVPEPAMAGLGCAGAAALLRRRRR